jgi:hypothetical protein
MLLVSYFGRSAAPQVKSWRGSVLYAETFGVKKARSCLPLTTSSQVWAEMIPEGSEGTDSLRFDRSHLPKLPSLRQI